MAEPHIYSQADLHSWVTLADVLDAHEALDVREALKKKQAEARK